MSSEHAIICAPVLPELDREVGSRRLFDHMILLQELGWTVSCSAQRAEGGTRYAREIRQRGIATYIGFDSRMERMIEASCPDLAILASWDVAETLIPLIRQLSPETRIIVDAIALDFQRYDRQAVERAHAGGPSSGLDDRPGFETVRELNTYAAADGVLAISRKEAQLIGDLTGDPELAHVVPVAEDLPASAVPFERRRGILFLGTFRHASDVKAADYLCQKVVPRIEPSLLAEHPLYLVRIDLNDPAFAVAAGRENVHLVGWVPSVLPYFQRARMCAVPLWDGAGRRCELVQSLMVGTPSVSTSTAIESLPLVDQDHVLIADDPSSFAAGISRLLQDEMLWHHVAQRGRERIMETHGRVSVSNRFREAIAAVLSRTRRPSGTRTRPSLEIQGTPLSSASPEQDRPAVTRTIVRKRSGTGPDRAGGGGSRMAPGQLRPAVAKRFVPRDPGAGHNVLVLGVYFAAEENNADDIVASLATTDLSQVTQRWIALGAGPPTPRMAEVTVRELSEKVPKFQLMNELLAGEDLARYDYVLLSDDDVVLPEGFLDRFLAIQTELEFVLAQPARTSNSSIDYPIVEQQRDVLARRTLFVEIGPMISIHRSCYDLILPFDITSPMGWGYENVWSYEINNRKMKMGIIDALPVDHSLRRPVAHYNWAKADSERRRYWSRHKHYPYDICFTTIDLYNFDGQRLR